MIKKNLFLILTILLVFSCYKNTSDEENNTIKILSFYNDNTSVKNQWDSMISEFSKKFPKFKLKQIHIHSKDYIKELDKYKENPKLYDLIIIDSKKINKDFFDDYKFKNLENFISQDNYISNYIKIFSDIKYLNKDNIFYLPYGIYISGVIYTNNNILKKQRIKYPSDLKEFFDVSKYFDEQTKYIPTVVSKKNTEILKLSLFNTILGRIAGNNWFADLGQGKTDFESSEFIKALDLFSEFFTQNVIHINNMEKIEYEKIQNLFFSEKTVFLLDGIWRNYDIAAKLPYSIKSNLSASTIPAIDGQLNNNTTFIPSEGFAISSLIDNNKVNVAWEFLKFFSYKQAQFLHDNFSNEVYEKITGYNDVKNFQEITILNYNNFIDSYLNNKIPNISDYLSNNLNDVLEQGLLDLAYQKITSLELAKKLDRIMAKEK